MSVIGRIGEAWRALRGGKSTSSEAIWRELFGGRPSKSGQEVNWRTALEVSTVFACARVLADGVAQVPFKLLKATGPNRAPAYDHPLYEVLYRRPNEWQTSFQFRHQLMLHRVLCGNAFAFVNRVAGRVVELLPLLPGNVVVEQRADHSLGYKIKINDLYVDVPAANIWHMRSASWNGWMGLEPVRLAREAIGLAMATEASQATMHKDGVRPSGVISMEGNITPEQFAPLREMIKKVWTENGSGLMILDRKATFLPTTMTGVDSQHLETRRFQVEDTARFFRVMPIMIGQADKASTYASAEQMFLAHVVHTLGPWYTDIEMSADVTLLTEAERAAGYYTKFNANALLRGDAKTRADLYAKALGSGGGPAWMTQDEVRELEELNPMGGPAGKLPAATNVAKPPGGRPADPAEDPPADPKPEPDADDQA